MKLGIRLAAMVAAVVTSTAGPALANDNPNCRKGTKPTTVTRVLHDNHEVAGEQVGEIIHDDVEPVTCA